MKMNQLFATLAITLPLIVSGQFSTPVEWNRHVNDPKDMEVADMDNDGWNDIVVYHSEQDKVGWFRNLGNGQYAVQQYLGSITNAHSVEIADIDENGYLDVLVANSAEVKAYLNQGDGLFNPGQTILSQANYRMRLCDLDNDGDDDLFLSTGSLSNVLYFENNGGNFSLLTTIPISLSSLKEFRFTDLDGDNQKDLVVCATFNNLVAWYKNLGSGSFGTQQLISNTQNMPSVMNIGDIDQDGDIDVVSGSENTQTIVWYANDGIGNFGGAQSVSTAVSSIKEIEISDLNGDNYPEIISNYWIANQTHLGIYLNTTGTFSYLGNIAPQFQGLRIVASDMDNNGTNDIVSIDASSYRLTLLKNQGNAQFLPPQFFSVFGSPERGRFTDVDMDGDLDILAYNTERPFWLENLGDKTFGAIFHYFPSLNEMGWSGSLRGAFMEDFNNDNIPDLIVHGSTGSTYPSVYFLPGLGNGLVGSAQPIATNQEFAIEAATADFNQDGHLDLLIGSSLEAAWYAGNGNGTFSSKISLGATQWCESVFASDMNNDGWVDALYVSEQDDAVYYCQNNNGVLASGTLIANGNISPNGIYAADLDGDNDNDLLVASRDDDKISWYENLGGGNFGSEQTIIGNFDTAFDVSSVDIDLDGDNDVVAVALNDTLSWFENLGNANFGPKQAIGNLPIGDQGIRLGDYDNDGDLDIVQPNFSYNAICVLENFNISEMQIKGRIFVDTNQNAAYDSLEYTIPQLFIETTPPAAFSYSYPDGRYFMNFNGALGTYQVAAQIPMHWTTTTPSSYNIVVDTNFTSITGLDFGFYPDSLVDTIEVAFIGGFPRCNDVVNYWLDMENIGTTFPSGIIDVELDDSLTYVSANMTPDSIVGQHVYWSYDSLFYFETMQLQMQVTMPDFNSMGDHIISYANVLIDSAGTIVWNTIDTIDQVVVCAYDPNDKAATPAGTGNAGYIWPAPQTIEYLIRFQNTGNDTAQTIVIRDQLDDNLVWNSLHPIAGSHPYSVERNMNGEVQFIFEDIMLPDSNVNEAASHGFILYAIDVVPNLPMGTVVQNTAYIYFDLNPPVITNTKIHTFDIATSAGLSELLLAQKSSIQVFPNPFNSTLHVRNWNLQQNYSVRVMDLTGKVHYQSDLMDTQECIVDLERLTQGMYLVQITNERGEVLHTEKVIRQ